MQARFDSLENDILAEKVCRDEILEDSGNEKKESISDLNVPIPTSISPKLISESEIKKVYDFSIKQKPNEKRLTKNNRESSQNVKNQNVIPSTNKSPVKKREEEIVSPDSCKKTEASVKKTDHSIKDPTSSVKKKEVSIKKSDITVKYDGIPMKKTEASAKKTELLSKISDNSFKEPNSSVNKTENKVKELGKPIKKSMDVKKVEKPVLDKTDSSLDKIKEPLKKSKDPLNKSSTPEKMKTDFVKPSTDEVNKPLSSVKKTESSVKKIIKHDNYVEKVEEQNAANKNEPSKAVVEGGKLETTLKIEQENIIGFKSLKNDSETDSKDNSVVKEESLISDTTKTETSDQKKEEDEEEEDTSGMKTMRKDMDSKMLAMEEEFAAGASKLAALRARMKKIREAAKANTELEKKEN